MNKGNHCLNFTAFENKYVFNVIIFSKILIFKSMVLNFLFLHLLVFQGTFFDSFRFFVRLNSFSIYKSLYLWIGWILEQYATKHNQTNDVLFLSRITFGRLGFMWNLWDEEALQTEEV